MQSVKFKDVKFNVINVKNYNTLHGYLMFINVITYTKMKQKKNCIKAI